MRVPGSTLVGFETPGQRRVATWGRRVFLTLLVVFVLAGGTGLLGVRTGVSSASHDGYDLSVTHATWARAGLDVPWAVRIHHPGGFDKTLTLAVSGDYFDIYETQGFYPTPSATTRDADTLYLTFTSPPGDTFVLTYDAYIQPSSQQGRTGSVRLLGQGGTTVDAVRFTTHLLP
ncbi:MAG: hypothetical protein ACXVWZ_13050 [Nocardioides sp.]